MDHKPLQWIFDINIFFDPNDLKLICFFSDKETNYKDRAEYKLDQYNADVIDNQAEFLVNHAVQSLILFKQTCRRARKSKSSGVQWLRREEL